MNAPPAGLLAAGACAPKLNAGDSARDGVWEPGRDPACDPPCGWVCPKVNDGVAGFSAGAPLPNDENGFAA